LVQYSILTLKLSIRGDFEIPNQNPTEIKLMWKWNIILEVGQTGGKFHKFHDKHPLERPTTLVFVRNFYSLNPDPPMSLIPNPWSTAVFSVLALPHSL
jgi:hypothetical protein